MIAARKPIILSTWLKTPLASDRPIIRVDTFDDLIKTICQNSPYLESLCERWPEVLEALLAKTPEAIMADIIDNIIHGDLEGLRVSLRRAKQKIHLLAALCDLAGYWNWADVTGYLSDFADAAMDVLIKAVANDMGFEAGDDGPVQGLFVLALGKYGGRELNYSSDIDLIVFYDPDLVKLPNPDRAERILIKFVHTLMRSFDEVTKDGYIFRTDLRLRPDPRSNSVAVSTLTAERYYESLGQNWERSAMIKARYCGGDKAAADMFIKNVLTPFVWRTSMDFAAVSDIHSIKRQSQTKSGETDFLAPGHNVKLGIGGIREIEIFTNVQQLILGGRNKNLRTPRTLDALHVLAEGNYIDDSIATICENSYGFLRDIEHRLQMFADEQTHKWPQDTEKRNKLSCLCGAQDKDAFEPVLSNVLSKTHSIYGELFEDEEDLSTAKGALMFTGVEPEDASLATLKAYGFIRGPEVWQLMADWLGGRIKATRSERARELLTRLAPRIIEVCGTTGTPDLAFFSFAEFITQLNAGVTLFSLFVNKPQALHTLIKMLTLAPPLVDVLARRPSLIDPMVEPSFLNPSRLSDSERYIDLIDEDVDFETAMNLVRRSVHEDQLSLIASMLNLQNIDSAGSLFSEFAQAAITALLPACALEITKRHGSLKGDYAVLALGKLGGQEMRYTSDVDIMLVYDPHPDDDERLYNKLTRRLITALSSVTQEGRLYEVDMALRPSGRSGPLAVSLEAFEKYYKSDAWTWEFMALTKARIAASSSQKFSYALTKSIHKYIVEKDFGGHHLAQDVLDMNARLSQEKPIVNQWQIKSVKGGMRDIEFIAQYLILSVKDKPNSLPNSTYHMLEVFKKSGGAYAKKCKILQEALLFYQNFSQMISITTEGVFDPHKASNAIKHVLARSSGFSTFDELMQEYEKHRSEVSALFNDII